MGSHVPGRVCVYCGEEKPWIFSGKKLRDGSKVYTNEFAVRWAGRRCPDCEKQRVHAAAKCNAFEKEQVIETLEKAGFSVSGDTLPITVEKDGQVNMVGVRKARASEGEILLSQPVSSDTELYALVFSSVRICTREQLLRMKDQIRVFSAGKGKKNRKTRHKEDMNSDINQPDASQMQPQNFHSHAGSGSQGERMEVDP